MALAGGEGATEATVTAVQRLPHLYRYALNNSNQLSLIASDARGKPLVRGIEDR